MTERFKMYGDNILVKPEQQPEYSEGGITLPKKEFQAGDIVRAEVISQPLDNRKFDNKAIVIYQHFNGKAVKLNNIEYHIIRIEDVLAEFYVEVEVEVEVEDGTVA